MAYFSSGDKRILVRKKGAVADFCPTCRRIEGFRLTHIQAANHLLGIPLWTR